VKSNNEKKLIPNFLIDIMIMYMMIKLYWKDWN